MSTLSIVLSVAVLIYFIFLASLAIRAISKKSKELKEKVLSEALSGLEWEEIISYAIIDGELSLKFQNGSCYLGRIDTWRKSPYYSYENDDNVIERLRGFYFRIVRLREKPPHAKNDSRY